MAGKAPNETDTSTFEVPSRSSSPTPHHRPGHRRAHRHHKSHHRGVAHHHGESHHHGEFQGSPDNAFSRHSPDPSTSFDPTASHSTVPSHHTYDKVPLHEEHHHGSRRHHGRPHHFSDSYHQKGLHHPGEFRHHGGFHHEGEPSHSKEYYQDSEYSERSGPHHSDAYDHSKHHHHPSHHHRRSLHPGESSSHYGLSHYPSERHHGRHSEHHHGHHRHRGEHHHREHHHGDYPRVTSRDLHTAHSMARASSVFQPSLAHKQSMAISLMRSHSTVHSHASKSSSKVHPLEYFSKTSESWPEDEQDPNKTSKTSRIHKKAHGGNFCSKLCGNCCPLFHGLRKMLSVLTQSLIFDAFIFIVVCLNIIMLVAQTFANVEIRGDFFIMAMAALEFTLVQFNSRSLKRTVYNPNFFRIFKVFKSLRALRAVRVLRRLSFLTSLQEVTGTLVRSMPSITAILVLMFTCLFLFSVVLRGLFRQSDPNRFQNIFTTIFTLFTLLTLDDWSQIYVDSRANGAWYIIPILMIYIVIQYFIFLNLVIAVLVDNFQMALLRGLEKVKLERAAQIQEKLLAESLTMLSEEEPREVMSEHTKQKLLIEKKFGTMTTKQQELLFHFLQLSTGVEHYQQKFRSQASVIDEIVDTAFEAGEEDFRK
ncbi:cation channel sperm-associated protein 1 isoform X2 [Eptesicus fuscus]|uniref:cation channel sperm-associated protein 1 isoform X2 n=1 Tax=Eptesicus fuscus TaxID=29078 RepID=UPI00101A9D2B|nr:cation channel sperm-associated protein 1 isoform X2 [Eptesicus fuscus]